MLSKSSVKARPTVLWCYKKELGFSRFVFSRHCLLTETCLIFALDSGYVDLRLNAGFELRTQTFWESTQTNRIWDFVLRFEAWLLKSTETLSAQKWNVMAIYCYGCSERCTWHLVVILFQKRWRCVLHELHVCHCQSSSSFIIQRVDTVLAGPQSLFHSTGCPIIVRWVSCNTEECHCFLGNQHGMSFTVQEFLAGA